MTRQYAPLFLSTDDGPAFTCYGIRLFGGWSSGGWWSRRYTFEEALLVCRWLTGLDEPPLRWMNPRDCDPWDPRNRFPERKAKRRLSHIPTSSARYRSRSHSPHSA